MKVKSWILREPSLDRRGLVRAEIVDDNMDFELDGNRLLDFTKERPEVLGPVLLVTLADHLAGSDVERCEQVGRPMSEVVGRPALGSTEIHRQNRLSAFKGLDLRLLVDA